MKSKTYAIEHDGGISAPLFPSSRFTLAIMHFFGTLCLYLMRANLSVALVCMTSDPSDTDLILNETTTPFDDASFQYIDQYNSDEAEFDWDRQLRGYILSSFFIGYLITQVPAGWLAPRIGGKWIVFSSMGIMTLLTFLSPEAARVSPYLLIAVQIGKGLVSGPFYPGMWHMWGDWAPPSERTKLSALALAGSSWGSIISFALSGWLCENGFAGGWPSVFYTYGIVSVVHMIGWFFMAYDTPSAHPRIKEKEKKYIEASLQLSSKSDEKRPPVIWSRVLTSFPLFAIVIADFSYQWIFYTGLTVFPQYFEDVLEFEITENGLANSLPWVVNFLTTVSGGVMADAIISRKLLSLINTRRLMQCIAMISSSVFVISAGFLNKDQSVLAVTFLTLTVGMLGFVRAGHAVNQLDIAPRYGGLVLGISNSVGTISGIVAPPVTSALTPNGTREEWQTVFYLCGGFGAMGLAVFLIFASGQVQPWAKTDEKPNGNITEFSDYDAEGNTNPVFNQNEIDTLY